MKSSKHKRKRILLHFFLGIGLPSLLLGYLAFRGIQNDQALLEKERLSEHRRIAELITKSIDEHLLEVEQAVLDHFASHRELQYAALLRSLDSLKNQHPLIEEVFFLENFKQIQLPIARLLFFSDGSGQALSTQPRPSSLLKKIQIAQQYEFQQKRYQKAMASYQRVFTQVSNHQAKGELLNAIARVQQKSTRLRDAIKSYETIAQDFSQTRMASGMPLGLAAQLELGSLFLAIHDSLRALQTFTGLYDKLIHREWAMAKSQYDFFTHQVKEALDDIFSQASLSASMPSYQNTFTMLKGEEKKQRDITERLLTFQEKAAPNVLAKVSRNMENLRGTLRRLTLEIGGRTYLVSLLSQQTWNGNAGTGIWGLLLNAEHLQAKLLKPVIQRRASSENTRWLVRGGDGQSLVKSEKSPPGTVTIKTNFVGNFPPWVLEFYQQDPRLYETLFTSGRSIYFYMFLLLAGILIFGLIFTIRTITHELELAKMKSDFVSTISHEFKSPLTSIRQLAEMLKTRRVPSEERRQRYYDVLLEQSERLSLLIDNILDFSKTEEGRKEFEFELVDIGALLQEIVTTIQHRVGHEGFVIQAKIAKPLPSINVDRAAITQAMTNLIDNAIKYSGEAKKVIIRASIENQHLIIDVQDFGVGIKKEEIDKVFERFYRGGDELTRTVKGSGLGLTLVKQIVEAHQGTVQVDSEPERGSTFTIRLPIELTN